MMRRPIVAGNWKMNGSKFSIQSLCEKLKKQSESLQLPSEIVVAPPFVFLSEVEQILKGSAIVWGAQDVSAEKEGAYTGEISASMLREFGCSYVIVGHSERRRYFGEDNQLIARKFAAAAQAGLKPILCLGETLLERQQSLTETVIAQQLEVILNLDLTYDLMHNTVLAYEPIWAIGTGVSAAPQQAQDVHAFIRQRVATYNKNLADSIRIIYGGSVKANNAAELFSMPDIDGALVGNASLDANEFLDIYRCSN